MRDHLRTSAFALCSLLVAACSTMRADRIAADTSVGACAPAGTSACPAACDRCDDGVCHIECSDGGECQAQTVTCAPGMDCALHCDGDESCKRANIVGPAGHALTVACDGRASCGDADVVGGGDLALECGGSLACGNAELRCGAGSCDWACVDADSCGDLSVE